MPRARGGARRRAIALAILLTAVAIAVDAAIRQARLPADPGLEALGPFFSFAGAAVLLVAAGFTWWLSHREPGVRTLRLVAAIGGAWLGAALGLIVAKRFDGEVVGRAVGLAPFLAWGEPWAFLGMALGAVAGAIAVRGRDDPRDE